MVKDKKEVKNAHIFTGICSSAFPMDK